MLPVPQISPRYTLTTLLCTLPSDTPAWWPTRRPAGVAVATATPLRCGMPPTQLTRTELQRAADLWRAVTGLPISAGAYHEPPQPGVVLYLLYADDAMWEGYVFHCGSGGDARRAFAGILIRDVLVPRPHQPTPRQHARISQIVVRYLRKGTVTKAGLRDVALLRHQGGLVAFFAERREP